MRPKLNYGAIDTFTNPSVIKTGKDGKRCQTGLLDKDSNFTNANNTLTCSFNCADGRRLLYSNSTRL